MALIKIMDIVKAAGEGVFLIMTSEKITVGVIKKIKTQILMIGVLREVYTLQLRIRFPD